MEVVRWRRRGRIESKTLTMGLVLLLVLAPVLLSAPRPAANGPACALLPR